VPAPFPSGTRPFATAGAYALAVALLTSACGAPPSSTGAVSGSSPSEGPSATATAPSVTPSSGQRCGDSHGSEPKPKYAFPPVAIPLGSDVCQDIGPLADPKIVFLTNDGSHVAFNAENYEYQGNLWYGDLADRSLKIAYEAQQSTSNRVDVLWPQLAAGQLVWLEYVHVGPYVSTAVKAWAIKDMDLASGAVKTVAQGLAPGSGGTKLVNEIRFDGQRIALAETLSKGWQLEIADLSGHIQHTVSSPQDIFDLALVSDGLLYSTGIDDLRLGTIGHMRLWHWTASGGPKEIAPDVFQINASGDLASWVTDPIGSRDSTGYQQAARLYAALAPFTSSQAVSPVDSETGTKGISGAACGSGTVAWWEQESYYDAWQDVLTLWQPGWPSAVQVDTEGNASYHVSLGGGWLVWSEEFGRETSPLLARIRGVPISVLTAARSS
jgi:hypothetical protein